MDGVQGSCGGLGLEAGLLKEQFRDGKAGIYLNFGGKRWHIVYLNTGEKECGAYQTGMVSLDGKKVDDKEGRASVSLEEIKGLSEDAVHELLVELV